jgi:hypothetical protein
MSVFARNKSQIPLRVTGWRGRAMVATAQRSAAREKFNSSKRVISMGSERPSIAERNLRVANGRIS